MKIEKIKNYNQKLLAILGTITIIFAFVGLITFITISISEYRRFNYDDDETGILSEEKIIELQNNNKREQVISYNTPRLIDTLNQVYIIPISHKSLNEPEEIGSKTLNLLNASGNFEYEGDLRYSSDYYGNFNNILVYNQKTENVTKLFDKRVNFSNLKVEYFSDDVLLVFKVAEKDTYKDGVINLLDFKSLYVYSINEKRMRIIRNDRMDVYSYSFLNNSKDLIVRFGIDKNGNGKYEEYNEPTIIKKYSYKSEKLNNIIEEKIDSELQKMLEGTKK